MNETPVAPPLEALADLREDVGEDEHEEQRLHDRPHDELAELPAQDAHVARPSSATNVSACGSHSRYSRPVSVRKTVSRLGGWLVASRDVEADARSPRRRAATSTPSARVANTRRIAVVALDGAHAVDRRGLARRAPTGRRRPSASITVSAPSVCLSSCGAAEGEHLAVVEDRDPLAERVGLLHVVRREQRSSAPPRAGR